MARGKSSGASLALWLALATLVVVLDQFTKWLILGHQLGDATPVTGFFNLVRAHNTGAAFVSGRWQRLAALVFRRPGAGCVRLHRLAAAPACGAAAASSSLAMILGGAVGNVVDRLQHGYVVDFLDFHWPILSGLFYRGHFPAFNLADAAITAGAVGLILDELLRVRQAR